MKLRKILLGISELCMIVLLILTVLIPASTQVYATNSSAATTLKITVPDTHDVQLVIDAHGIVRSDGVVYRENGQIHVARLTRKEYRVQAEKGWQIVSVMYAGEEQKRTSEKLTQLTFTAPAIREDGQQLVVLIKEDKSAGGDTEDPDVDNPDKKDTDTKKPDTKNTDKGDTKAKLQPLSNTVKGNVYQRIAAKTDDMSNILLYGVLMVLASGMIVVLKRKHKKA